MIASNVKYKEHLYNYNENGRIILPTQEEISKLPEDGGALWNRLIFESSPYLLQHSANPINWYPWSKEAFDIAKQLNRPIFLSIGYTTCHWCHVMEHESFEDEEVAKLMNDTFINIKVDREERPDIDNVYMEVTQTLTGRGGWPMTIIMTPDKHPFFAGTYFPKKSIPQYKRIGMLELVPAIQNLWKNKNDSLINNALDIVNTINDNNMKRSKKNIKINPKILINTYNAFESRFDESYGGFLGSKNKFPKPHDYSFLAKYYYFSKNDNSLRIINKSLIAMRQGGIFDQIGFGFHRYSTDEKWLVPHFEKMLYDQALLVHAYLDAYLVTNDAYYIQTVNEICEYVLNRMTDSKGGFYSAEDADSEGEEGTFYIWKNEDLKNILTNEEYLFISDVLNINQNGNAIVEDEKVNIPHFTKTWRDIYLKYENKFSSENELLQYYNYLRSKIYKSRESRVHPQKDDKILTDWNGLMISALARAGAIIKNDKYILAAQKSTDFLIDNLINEEGALLKRYRKGISGIDGMIEDYAFFIWGLLELYQITFKDEYINLAVKLSDYQIEHFWDSENHGFYFTSNLSESLIMRSKEIYDGAIPSGNSVSACNYIKLSKILSRKDYEDIAIKLIDAFASTLNKYGTASSMMMQAVNMMQNPFYEVIIVGDKAKCSDIINELHNIPQPNKVLIYYDGVNKNKNLSFLDFYKSKDNGSPLIYVCQNYSCKLPTSDLSIIKGLLK
tara:strand:+ start:102 stop:2288 length:2187 start_codon:yes stop_codon:yes gene_type:complete